MQRLLLVKSRVRSNFRCRTIRLGQGSGAIEYDLRSAPVSASSYIHAFPVRNIEEANRFYVDVLGCAEGARTSDDWQDYTIFGHRIVAHWVGDDYRCVDYFNPVDDGAVPRPHFGLQVTVDEYHVLVDRLRRSRVGFVVAPGLKFRDQPSEQYSCFFKDPSGNNFYLNAPTNPGVAAHPGCRGRFVPPSVPWEPPKVDRVPNQAVDMSKLSQSGRRSLFRTQSDRPAQADDFGARHRDLFRGARDVRAVSDDSSASAKSLPALVSRSRAGSEDEPRAVFGSLGSRSRANSEDEDRFASPPRRGALGDRPAPVVVSPISKVDGIRRRSTSC